LAGRQSLICTSIDIQTSTRDWNHSVFRAGSLLPEVAIPSHISHKTSSTSSDCFLKYYQVHYWSGFSVNVAYALASRIQGHTHKPAPVNLPFREEGLPKTKLNTLTH